MSGGAYVCTCTGNESCSLCPQGSYSYVVGTLPVSTMTAEELSMEED